MATGKYWVAANSYQVSQGSHAPMVRFGEPEGPEDQGRDGMTSPPIRTEVGMSLPLTIEVTKPGGTAPTGG